ncbi:hypothetical protein L596_022918 [Steinernema carpocapsae]|uniref:G-protein coupled receptors family 1 profile domain-containing protein n=1 Tax=Steinernema carpocapsae TaxID=34508 RepID=A0A4U5MCX0_STECR|nr:hypothetical protein L596_022918 [Steinernema carpocapsae]
MVATFDLSLHPNNDAGLNKVVSFILLVLTGLTCFEDVLIMFVTLRYKAVRNTCTILIFILALSDFIYQLYKLYSHKNLISFYPCHFINVVFVPEIDFSTVMVFCIVFDRLVSVYFPIFYIRFIRPYFYCYIIVIVPLAISYAITYDALQYITSTNNKYFDYVLKYFTVFLDDLWLLCGNFWYFGTFVMYLALLWKLKSEPKPENDRLDRAVCIFVGIYIINWLLTYIGCAVGRFRSQESIGYRIIEAMVGILINVITASWLFIFYFQSTLYRTAFDKMLGRESRNVGPRAAEIACQRAEEV